MAYDPLDLNDLGADKILTEQTMQALHNNPIEIAQRGVGAPRVQPGVEEWLYVPAGSPQVWAWPDGVTAIVVDVVGGGGSGAFNGTASYVIYNGETYTAGGGTVSGAGGTVSWSGPGAPDMFINGTPGIFYTSGGSDLSKGGDTPFGYGFGSHNGVAAGPTGWGAGSMNAVNSRRPSSGAVLRKRFVRVPGQDTLTWFAGPGGATGANTPYPGGTGVIVIRY